MNEQTTNRTTKPRILSGMRPTGRLHLGNLVGALENWIELQNHFESYHCVVDWHMLTTDYANTADLQENIWQMTADWLAAGLDPVKAAFFVQSRIIEHAELHLLLSMITPLGWLERVPTYKEQLENIKDRDIHTYGFLGYPVLQAADIVIYKANAVPVGEDQAPHIELAREIARRFNLAYGELVLLDRSAHEWDEWGRQYGEIMPPPGVAIKPSLQRWFRNVSFEKRADLHNKGLGTLRAVFPEPQTLLTPTPRLPGTDGRKMSKSYGNAIYLSDTPEEVSKKVAGMVTDPARKRRYDKGNPDVCPVFDHHKVFSPQPVIERVNRECRTAEIGCVDCKKLMAAALNERLAPIQERRRGYEQKPHIVWDVLDEGTGRARKVAQATMAEVREAMGLVRTGLSH
jgi:tryptophanyl-tRNA synthetase